MSEHRSFVCLSIQQRDAGGLVMASFVASAKDVVKWAGVRRVGEHEEGMQRTRKKSRVKAIRGFMANEARNTIPTSIVLAFCPGSAVFVPFAGGEIEDAFGQDPTNGVGQKVRWGKLDFSFDPALEEWQRPALIVDGQHRLHGLALVDEHIPVMVTALLDASSVEQAFQFIVINNKATKVLVDNVKSIIAEFDEEELSERLKQARINYKETPGTLYDFDTGDDSPFRALIDWPTNQGTKVVKPATVEACLRYIRQTFPTLQELDDDDTIREIFKSVWRAAKATYPGLFPSNERFMSKVCMTALNEAVVDRISSAVQDGGLNLFDPDEVAAYAKDKVFSGIPARFWLDEWSVALSDSTPVRNRIKDGLRRVGQNARLGGDREWSDGVDIIVS